MIKDNVIRIPIHLIKPNAWNPNRQSDFIYSKEIESIKKHGQVVPVLVREMGGYYEIIDGEHRFKAMRELGFREISVNNLGALDQATCQQLTVILNEVKGKADTGLMRDLLLDLESQVGRDELEKMLPYDSGQLDSYLKEISEQAPSVGTERFQVSDFVDVKVLQPGDRSKPPVTAKATQDYAGGVDFPSGGDEYRPIYLKLPVAIAEQFQTQLDRFNRALFPDEKDLSSIYPGTAVQAISQHLAQIEDSKLI